MKAKLKLKYTRAECKMIATWLNDLSGDESSICEMMHPKRSMWVRFIRALRLSEYCKKPGFEKLKIILDKFYRQDYEVWQGRVDQYRLRKDAEATMSLLKQRPGLFARSLFANILWFGTETTINAFREIIEQVPARLLINIKHVCR